MLYGVKKLWSIIRVGNISWLDGLFSERKCPIAHLDFSLACREAVFKQLEHAKKAAKPQRAWEREGEKEREKEREKKTQLFYDIIRVVWSNGRLPFY